MRLNKVLKLFSVPVETGDPSQWSEIERQIGVVLPNDYKQFINTYGSGAVWGNIRIWNPFSSNPHFNFFQRLKQTLAILQHHLVAFPEHYDFILYPIKGGLLPFGDTVNGDLLLWDTSGNADTWELIILVDFGPEYERHPANFTTLLSNVITQQISESILLHLFKQPEFFVAK